MVPAWLAASFVFGGGLNPFNNYNTYSNNQPTQYASTAGLSLNGGEITNIYPFDAQGRQVSVRLYDQDGKPLDLRLQDCAAHNDPVTRAYEEINQFPLRAVVPDQYGSIDPDNCKDSDKAPFIPPAVSVTPPTTPSTGATPSAGPTSAPSASKPVTPSTTPRSSGPVSPSR